MLQQHYPSHPYLHHSHRTHSSSSSSVASQHDASWSVGSTTAQVQLLNKDYQSKSRRSTSSRNQHQHKHKHKHSKHGGSSSNSMSSSSSRRRKVTMQLDIYLDLLCPWCFLEKKSLESAMARFESEQNGVTFEVSYKPFYLYPLLRKGVDKQEFMGRALGPSLSSIAHLLANYGIELDITGQTGPSRNAHVLVALAARLLSPDRQSYLIDSLFQGHFSQGQDLSNDLWLMQVGKSMGLPEDVLRAEFAKGEAGRRIDEQVERAGTEEGVEAVPCVTVQGKYRVGGYQDEDVFERLFERVWADEVGGSFTTTHP